MKKEYVTIWSKSKYSGSSWVIERTHTIDYTLTLFGITTKEAEVIEINGRYYMYLQEGKQPQIKK